MTWQEPTITENYIGGTLNDLLKLSDIITHKLNAAKVGQTFKIMDEYSKKSTSALLFIIMADDFVPSSIEFNYLTTKPPLQPQEYRGKANSAEFSCAIRRLVCWFVPCQLSIAVRSSFGNYFKYVKFNQLIFRRSRIINCLCYCEVNAT